ncbi:MAG: tetratricopeptide repeat protein, partial [Deltaproteobacteria bacterium]|nr:tetratricopeptide repeat protein [Deltaproteobacteria bacterium]
PTGRGRLPLCMTLATLLIGASACASGPGTDDVRVAQAEYGLAADAFHRGRYREALEHVQKATERDEDNADVAYLGAMIMLVFCADDDQSPDCHYDEAERFLRLALEGDPGMRDAKNALGVVLVHDDRPKEAVEVLEPLAQDMLYRSPEKAWGNLGWAYLKAGQHDEAIPALKRAIAAQPLFCVGHYRLGLAYEKKGEYAAARHSFTRALSIEEGQCGRLQDAFWARARVQEKLGLRAEVTEDLQRCKELARATTVGKTCARRLETRQ